MAYGSAFLDTRRRWQEKMDGGPQRHMESPVMEEREPSQSPKESLHEVDSFVESDPFLGDESLENGARVKDKPIHKINGSQKEETGEKRIEIDESFVKGGKPEAEVVKEDQSNLAKILDKMKKNMDAEEAERKKLKEKQENQKELVKEGSRQSEKFSSHRDRHRSSENSMNSAFNQNKYKHEAAGREEVKCLKSKELMQPQNEMRKEKTSNRRVEDAKVTESRRRLEAKLNKKRE